MKIFYALFWIVSSRDVEYIDSNSNEVMRMTEDYRRHDISDRV